MMKKHTLLALIFFSLAFLCFSTVLTLNQKDNLYDSVIRIHVLANSNEKEDQTKKLLVRDSIIKYAEKNLADTKNKDEAKEEIEKNLECIQKVAEETLLQNGCNHAVKVTLEEEYYPTRHYEALSLPSGKYLSLKVNIGAAQGKNWWCVLFPPLCLSSATKSEDALMDAGMTKENVDTVLKLKKEYKIRFRLYEIFEETRQKLTELF